jgi:hypothetical protein
VSEQQTVSTGIPGASTEFTPELQVTIARLREEVSALHAELVRYGLVVWTGGNVSARVPGAELFVIKPSGVAYDDLGPTNMILCDFDGAVIPDTPGRPGRGHPVRADRDRRRVRRRDPGRAVRRHR